MKDSTLISLKNRISKFAETYEHRDLETAYGRLAKTLAGSPDSELLEQNIEAIDSILSRIPKTTVEVVENIQLSKELLNELKSRPVLQSPNPDEKPKTDKSNPTEDVEIQTAPKSTESSETTSNPEQSNPIEETSNTVSTEEPTQNPIPGNPSIEQQIRDAAVTEEKTETKPETDQQPLVASHEPSKRRRRNKAND